MSIHGAVVKALYAPHTKKGIPGYADRWEHERIEGWQFNCTNGTARESLGLSTVTFEDGTSYSVYSDLPIELFMKIPPAWPPVRPEFAHVMRFVCAWK